MGASQAIPVSAGRALSTIPSESNCADIRTEVRCEFGGYISIATTLVTKGYTRIDKRVPLIVRAPENRPRIVTTASFLRTPRPNSVFQTAQQRRFRRNAGSQAPWLPAMRDRLRP